MKISAANSHAKAMQAKATQHTNMTSMVGGQGTSPGAGVISGSATQVGGATEAGAASQSPSERLARLEAHMQERLAMFEERGAEAGINLDQVRADFQHNMQRLQDAMANGMQGDDLARGIENMSNLVRDGVREAMGIVTMRGAAGTGDSAGTGAAEASMSTNIDIEHTNSRLDAIEQRLQERMDSLFEAGTEADKEMVHGAREEFNGHMERLRNALATGNMSHEDMRRSMETIMQHLQDNLQGATSYASSSDGAGSDGPAANVGAAASAATIQPTANMEAKVASRVQALSLLSQDMKAAGSETFSPQLSDLLKPGTPAGDFLLEMREASHKAKGGGSEGYTQAAIKSALLTADLPGSSLNFKV